jgi:hypothetical protein
MPCDRRRFLRTILGASGAVVLGDGLAWPSTAIPTSRSSGFLIQSNIGTVGNFEVLVPRALGGGLAIRTLGELARFRVHHGNGLLLCMLDRILESSSRLPSSRAFGWIP